MVLYNNLVHMQPHTSITGQSRQDKWKWQTNTNAGAPQSSVLTDNEAELLLNITLEHKVNKMHKNAM